MKHRESFKERMSALQKSHAQRKESKAKLIKDTGNTNICKECSNCFNYPAIIKENINLDDLNGRQKIEIIEYCIINGLVDGVTLLDIDDIDTKHEFMDGYYIRSMTLFKGELVIGRIHIEDHIFMVSCGDIEISIDGDSRRIVCDLDHPVIIVVPTNSKKIMYAFEDTIISTFQKSDSLDYKEIFEKTTFNSDLSWIDKLLITSPGKEKEMITNDEVEIW